MSYTESMYYLGNKGLSEKKINQKLSKNAQSRTFF